MCICLCRKRGCINVTAIVYPDCGKKRERGGAGGEIMQADDWRGFKMGPGRKGLREEWDECRGSVKREKRHPGPESRREGWIERDGEGGEVEEVVREVE